MDIDYTEVIGKLLNDYSGLIEEKIENGSTWRLKIEKDKLSKIDEEKLLRDICEQLLLQGRNSKGVATQISSIEKRIPEWNIESLEKELNKLGMSDMKRGKLKDILHYSKEHSVCRWVNELNKERDNIPRMGPKSDDDFLKEHGFFEHIPVDRHTQRFLFRRGILNWFFMNADLKRPEEDILTLFGVDYYKKYYLFQKVLIEFCRKFASKVYFTSSKGKLLLSENPGIIDFAIWAHRKVCGRFPECNKCTFNETCLEYMPKQSPTLRLQ